MPKADYLLSFKENHETFYDKVKELLQDPETLKDLNKQGIPLEIHTTEVEKNRGRLEKRSCVVLEKTDWFREE